MGLCKHCGYIGPLILDHITPRWRHGHSGYSRALCAVCDHPSNLQLLCSVCDREKRRRDIGEALMGNQHSLGRVVTTETRARISEAKRGKRYGTGMTGRSHSDESRAKMRESWKRRLTQSS